MITKRFTSTLILAAASILTLSGMGVSLQNASIQLIPAAQAASCDPNIRYVNFSGVVGKNKPGVNANLRTAPSTSASVSRVAANNTTLYFDA